MISFYWVSFDLKNYWSQKINSTHPERIRQSSYLQKQPPEEFLYENVFLEISQNSQEKTCARVSLLIKLEAWGLQLY